MRHVRAIGIREYMTTIKDSSKAIIEAKIRGLGVADKFRVYEREIRGPNESLIVFRGMQTNTGRGGTATGIKSSEGFNLAWIDEAQQLSRKSADILYPTFRAAGSEIWASWNPRDPKDAIDAFFRHPDSERDPQIACVRVNYSDNPWFPPDLRIDMERDRRRDPDKYAHIWLGEYETKSEARVFRNWKIGTVDIPPSARPYFGADWGFARDPTVLLRCWVFDRTLYIDREVYQVGCEIDRTPELFDRINDDRVTNVRSWPIIADSARPETISYMRKHGFTEIVAARKGPRSVEEGVEFLKNYDIVIHPDCIHTSDEFSLYAYKIDPRTDEVLPELADGNEHCVDSARYAVEKLRRVQPEIFVMPYAPTNVRAFPG